MHFFVLNAVFFKKDMKNKCTIYYNVQETPDRYAFLINPESEAIMNYSEITEKLQISQLIIVYN